MKGLNFFLLFFLGAVISDASCQPLVYSVANAHSHNDYEQKKPFFQAYNKQFGSIETDIHLAKGILLVGHDSTHLVKKRTLEKMYLAPLSACIKKNAGYAYKDSSKRLQLLIDLKTDGFTTLNSLVELLNKFPLIIYNPTVRIVITGNRPDESLYGSYPSYIWFDGRLDKDYSPEVLSRIAMLSDDFTNYSHWAGNGYLPAFDSNTITTLIYKSHHLQKPIRFWACPDFARAWEELVRLKVDYINTDHINALSDFFARRKK